MDEHAIVLRSVRPPLDGIIAAWLDARASHSDETYRAYTYTLASFRDALATLKPPLDLDDADPRAVRELLGGQMAATDLTVETIEDHMEARLAMLATAAQAWAKTIVAGENEPQPATHNRRLAIISSFYRYALNQGLLRGANPVTRVRRRAVQSYARARAIPLDHLDRSLTAIDIDDLAGLRDYALIQIGLHTGRRASELALLRRADITVAGTTVGIDWPRCKGGKVFYNEFKVTDAPAQALLAWLRMATTQTPYLDHPEAAMWFSLSRNGSIGEPLGRRAIARICAKRLQESQVHKLRHTFAQTLEDAHAPMSRIAALLGHTNIATTSRYLARLSDGRNAYTEELSQLYGGDKRQQLREFLQPIAGSNPAEPSDDDA